MGNSSLLGICSWRYFYLYHLYVGCKQHRWSMVMASLIHLSTNFGMNIVFILGLTPPHQYLVISSTIYTVYAIVVTIVAGPSKLSRKLDSVQRPT